MVRTKYTKLMSAKTLSDEESLSNIDKCIIW